MLSILVLTSPGRESHLQRCLAMLSPQSCRSSEVIVVDDGSRGGEEIAHGFNPQLPLTYNWRPNDCCLSRSRNIGAELARTPYLVYIDSDILLNPRALAVYQRYATELPEAIVYGYFGDHRETVVPSVWFSPTLVQWMDVRFELNPDRGLVPYKQVLTGPFLFGWGGNFGLALQTYEKLGGFDENFIGWGAEDLDFSCRAILKRIEIHFSLDTWGEHQLHNWLDRFHLVSRFPQNKQIKDAKIKELLIQVGNSEAFYQPTVLQEREAGQLNNLIQRYYSRFK